MGHRIVITDPPNPTGPVAANEDFTILYSASNGGDEEAPAHRDRISVTDGGGSQHFESYFDQTGAVEAGGSYSVFFNVTGLAAGDYHLVVRLDADNSDSNEESSSDFTVS